MNSDARTGREFRARIAYHGVRIYRLAPRVDLHPSRLSLILNERVRMPAGLAARLTRAIDEEARRP